MKVSESRVLFLTSAVAGGGGERHFMRLVPKLLKEAKARLLISLRRAQEDSEIEGVPVKALDWQGSRSYPGSIRAVARIIRQEKIDLVYSFSRCANFVAHYGIAISGCRPAWVAGVNSQPGRAFDLFPTLAGRFWMAMKQRVYPKADLVLCNSTSALDEMVTRFFCNPDRLRVVKNPIPIDVLKKAATEPSAIDTRSPRRYFLCVSRLCEGKGIEDLLEAFRKVSHELPHSLVVVGDGPLANRLAESVCEKNIEGRVLFVGWKENPFPYYARADVFVTASYWEGLPNTVLEAFALGAAVVATRCTSWIDEYAAAGACLPVEVGDVAGLAEAMARVASDHSLRERLRTAGARTIGAYRQEVVVGEREALLRGMLEARPAERGAS